MATIDSGASSGSVTCRLAWPLGSSQAWEITARVSIVAAGGGLTRWVDVGVEYADAKTVVMQLDSAGGGTARTRGGGSQGSISGGTLALPLLCWTRLRVDHGRITVSVSESASGPWSCCAEGTGLVSSGLTPAISYLYLAANMSGGANATNTYTIDLLAVTDLDPRPTL